MSELWDELWIQAKEVDRIDWTVQDMVDVRPIMYDTDCSTLYVWSGQGMRGYFTMDTANGQIDYWDTWSDLLKQLDWE